MKNLIPMQYETPAGGFVAFLGLLRRGEGKEVPLDPRWD